MPQYETWRTKEKKEILFSTVASEDSTVWNVPYFYEMLQITPEQSELLTELSIFFLKYFIQKQKKKSRHDANFSTKCFLWHSKFISINLQCYKNKAAKKKYGAASTALSTFPPHLLRKTSFNTGGQAVLEHSDFNSASQSKYMGNAKTLRRPSKSSTIHRNVYS